MKNSIFIYVNLVSVSLLEVMVLELLFPQNPQNHILTWNFSITQTYPNTDPVRSAEESFSDSNFDHSALIETTHFGIIRSANYDQDSTKGH